MVQENVCKYCIAPTLLLVPILDYVTSRYYCLPQKCYKQLLNFLHKSGVAMATILAAVPVPVYIQPRIHYTTVTALATFMFLLVYQLPLYLVYLQDRFAFQEALPPIDPSQDWFLVRGEEDGGYTILEFTRNWTTCDDRDRDIVVCM